MWIQIGEQAIINLDNVGEVAWGKYGVDYEYYGFVAFFNTNGDEIDHAELKTKSEYESAVDKLSQLIHNDLIFV